MLRIKDENGNVLITEKDNGEVEFHIKEDKEKAEEVDKLEEE